MPGPEPGIRVFQGGLLPFTLPVENNRLPGPALLESIPA
jgi:hypothetical protein